MQAADRKDLAVLVEHAIAHAIADAMSAENITIDVLTRRIPIVKSRYQLKYVHLEQTIASALTERRDASPISRKQPCLLRLSLSPKAALPRASRKIQSTRMSKMPSTASHGNSVILGK
jgi:hypothetical protein